MEMHITEFNARPGSPALNRHMAVTPTSWMPLCQPQSFFPRVPVFRNTIPDVAIDTDPTMRSVSGCRGHAVRNLVCYEALAPSILYPRERTPLRGPSLSESKVTEKRFFFAPNNRSCLPSSALSCDKILSKYLHCRSPNSPIGHKNEVNERLFVTFTPFEFYPTLPRSLFRVGGIGHRFLRTETRCFLFHATIASLYTD